MGGMYTARSSSYCAHVLFAFQGMLSLLRGTYYCLSHSVLGLGLRVLCVPCVTPTLSGSPSHVAGLGGVAPLPSPGLEFTSGLSRNRPTSSTLGSLCFAAVAP